MINDEKQLKEIVNLIVSLPAHLLNIYQLQSLPYEIFKKKNYYQYWLYGIFEVTKEKKKKKIFFFKKKFFYKKFVN